MPLRWSVLALSLCWLEPFAHETGRKEPLPGYNFDRPRLASPLKSLLGHAGGGSLGNGDGRLTLAAGSADSQNEPGRVTTHSRGLFRHRFRPSFPFRNQGRLPPFPNVLFRGTRGGDGVAVNSSAAATDKRP